MTGFTLTVPRCVTLNFFDAGIYRGNQEHDMTFILTANKNGETFFWTGRSGQDWISTDRDQAFAVTLDEARRKAEIFNTRVELTSLIFEAVGA